jgi:hypothetical protein
MYQNMEYNAQDPWDGFMQSRLLLKVAHTARELLSNCNAHNITQGLQADLRTVKDRHMGSCVGRRQIGELVLYGGRGTP